VGGAGGSCYAQAMSKNILICGYGPGISAAVARKFGAEGFSVALAARSGDRLAAAVASLEGAGVRAAAFPTDLAEPAAVKALVQSAREKLGPVSVLHWNAYARVAGDLLTADPAEIRTVLDVGVTSLVVAVQAALPDLEAQKGAVLVTGGGFAMDSPQVDAMAAQWGAMGVAVTKAAQHKLVGVLGAKLEGRGVYVGEVMVMGLVKGSAADTGQGTLEASDIAAKFWEMHGARSERSVTFG
jgi:NADP-dependent 3-hydroxy acid dehydrogenase YdfG